VTMGFGMEAACYYSCLRWKMVEMGQIEKYWLKYSDWQPRSCPFVHAVNRVGLDCILEAPAQLTAETSCTSQSLDDGLLECTAEAKIWQTNLKKISMPRGRFVGDSEPQTKELGQNWLV